MASFQVSPELLSEEYTEDLLHHVKSSSIWPGSSQLTGNVREEARASPVSDPEIESYLFVFSVQGMTSIAD